MLTIARSIWYPDCVTDYLWFAVTTGDQMAAHRKLDRRRGCLCAVGLRKRAWSAAHSFSLSANVFPRASPRGTIGFLLMGQSNPRPIARLMTGEKYFAHGIKVTDQFI
jgi:hypothetical protein